MKKQGSGWKGESRRHSLARKGVKTANGKFKIEYDYNNLIQVENHIVNHCHNIRYALLRQSDLDPNIALAEIKFKKPIKINAHITNKWNLTKEFGELPQNEFDYELGRIQDKEMIAELRHEFPDGEQFNLMQVEYDVAQNYFTVYSIYGEFKPYELKGFIKLVNDIGGSAD